MKVPLPPSWFSPPAPSPKLIKKDEPDNRFLECANAAGAAYIITGNTKHLPDQFENVRIVTPQQFLELVGPQLAQEGNG